MDAMIEANRDAWDALAKSHYEKYHIEKLLRGEALLSEVIRLEVGEVRGKSLVHLLCHIGTDTLSWALLGAQVTGVDISPEAIKYARLLAQQMKLPASFIISDVMDLAGKLEPIYDIAFASTGAICWVPDIDRFAATVRALLKPGGFFYLHESHPLRNALERNEHGEPVFAHDYFNKVVSEYEHFTDYTDLSYIVEKKNYEWNWTMGDLITACAQNRLRIEFLHEYPQFFYSGYTGFDVEEDKRELYPCTFSLKAVAED